MGIKGLQLKAWYEFFKVYAQEPIDNIYVKNFDVDVPLLSILNTFLSDFLVFQCFEFFSDESQVKNFEFFLPAHISIEGKNNRSKKIYTPINCSIRAGLDGVQWIYDIIEANMGNRKLIVAEIQKAVLTDQVLFRFEGGIYEPGQPEEYDENGDRFLPVFYTAEDGDQASDLPNTDEIELKVFFRKAEHKAWMPVEIIDPLFSIAVFTKRNKLSNNNLLARANRNAIAKVMARNTTHNIGSHVLSKVSTAEDVRGILNKNTYRSNFDIKSITSNPFVNEKIELHGLSDKEAIHRDEIETDIYEMIHTIADSREREWYIAHFYKYLQDRQELLADILTGIASVQNVKSIISQVFKPFDLNKILLSNITGGVNNFSYEFKFSGLLHSDINKPLNDVPVSISNDVIGCQAFYIVLENIIRNTAKHGLKRGTEENVAIHCTFTIDVDNSDLDDEYYKVTIYDDLPISGYSYLSVKSDLVPNIQQENRNFIRLPELEFFISPESQASLFNSLLESRSTDYVVYSGTVYDEEAGSDYHFFKIKNVDRLRINQNAWINEPILSSFSQDLRENALGLIEMQVCAAYLRKVSIENIEGLHYTIEFDQQRIIQLQLAIKEKRSPLRLLEAVTIPCSNEDSGYLGYQFFLPKPKSILIVDEADFFNSGTIEKALEALEAEWKKFGIDYLHRPSLGLNKSYEHDIMLVIPKDEHWPSRFDDKYPVRRVTLEECQESFKGYQIKRETRRRALQKYEPYDIDFDLVNAPKESVLEIWRAYLFVRSNRKNVKIIPKNYNTLLPKSDLKNPADHDPIRSHHGTNLGKYLAEHSVESLQDKYYEVFESKFKRIVEIVEGENGTYPKGNLITRLKYLDATLSNVFIIDERIQSQVYEKRYKLQGVDKEVTYADLWSMVGVFIPSIDQIDLNSNQFEDSFPQKINAIAHDTFGRHSKRTIKGLDFLVIHLGVIEKILAVTSRREKENSEDRKWVIDEIVSGFGEDIRVILTSGRAPTDLPRDFCFLSYSIIAQHLVNNRFKMNLHEVLNAARPKFRK